jgi:hypothetical protein
VLRALTIVVAVAEDSIVLVLLEALGFVAAVSVVPGKQRAPVAEEETKGTSLSFAGLPCLVIVVLFALAFVRGG